MSKLVVEDVPPGLTEPARREHARFEASYQVHLQEIQSISLSILVWGPSPQSPSPVARKRLEIREVLIELGHNAMFSEELSAYGQEFSAKFREFAQAKAAHLILILLEDAPGALAEAHDFCSHPDITPKLYVMIPQRYQDGYSAQGAIRNLETAHGGVYWYKDEEIGNCNVMRQALVRVQAWREIYAMLRITMP